MKNHDLKWDEEAINLLKKVPAFVRPMAKKKIEKAALNQGFDIVTVEFMQQVRQSQQ